MVVGLVLLCIHARADITVEYTNGFENGAFITVPARSSEWGIITSCSGATAVVNGVSPRSGSKSAVLTVKSKCGAVSKA